MRLAPAISLADLVEGFEGPGLRPRRRRRRRKGRRVRRQPPRWQAAQPVPQPAPASPRVAPPARPAPQEPRPRMQRVAPAWTRAIPDVLDAALDWIEPTEDWEEGEALDAWEDDELEGLRRPSRRAPRRRAWGPLVDLGPNVRVQAAQGHRAAVIALRPGLYLVGEVPEVVTRPEFGLAPMIGPMMMNAARGAMAEPQPVPGPRGPLGALFRRRGRRGGAVRALAVHPATPPAQDAPLALPGPVASPPTTTVAVPNVGWAEDREIAAAIGCEACDGRCSG